MAKQEFAVVAKKFRRLWILEKQRAHQGNSGPRHFFDCGVNVGQQAVALFNEVFADRGVLRAVYPGFLVRGAFRGVVAVDGIECAGFDPTGKKGRRWRSGKSADIVAHHSVAGNSHAEQHRRAHAEMIPNCDVVAGPGRGVALSAGIGSTRQHKRPLVRPQLQQSFLRGAHILHSKNVVNCKMRQRGTVVQTVAHIERHGLGRGQKD